MNDLLLTMGNKNYSSWSLRPWVLMKHLGLPFEERVLQLDTAQFAQEIAALSPTRRVPILRRGALGMRRNAFRVRSAALTMAHECARHRTPHAVGRGARCRHRAHRPVVD